MISFETTPEERAMLVQYCRFAKLQETLREMVCVLPDSPPHVNYTHVHRLKTVNQELAGIVDNLMNSNKGEQQ